MVLSGFTRPALVSMLAAVAAACTTQLQPPPAASVPAHRDPNRCGGEPVFAAGGDRATLWIRNASEFRAASETIYRAALEALAAGLADPAWTAEPTQDPATLALPPAVVMDIDETVLD